MMENLHITRRWTPVELDALKRRAALEGIEVRETPLRDASLKGKLTGEVVATLRLSTDAAGGEQLLKDFVETLKAEKPAGSLLRRHALPRRRPVRYL